MKMTKKQTEGLKWENVARKILGLPQIDSIVCTDSYDIDFTEGGKHMFVEVKQVTKFEKSGQKFRVTITKAEFEVMKNNVDNYQLWVFVTDEHKELEHMTVIKGKRDIQKIIAAIMKKGHVSKYNKVSYKVLEKIAKVNYF